MKKYCLVVFLFCLLYTSFFSRIVNAEQPTLKIMTFNSSTGTTVRNGAKFEMENLANYIKNNDLDIVALQEMANRSYRQPFPQTDDDVLLLDMFLKKINYPMYWYAHPYQLGGLLFYRIVTFSKYPVVENGYKEFLINSDFNNLNEKERWAVVTTFNTPLGLVKTMNIHTHLKMDICTQIFNIEKQMILDTNKNSRLIVLGDWNDTMYKPQACKAGWPAKYEFFCKKSCGNQGVKTDPYIENSIDYPLAFKNTSFELVNDWKDLNYPYSEHRPNISVLKLKLSEFDFNKDEKNNIDDVLFFIRNHPQFSISYLITVIKTIL